MPKLTENLPTDTGTATTGRAYKPAVTPNARDDDDSRVIGARNSGRDRMEHGQYGRDEEDRRTGAASGRDQRDVINEDSLQASYGGSSNNNRYNADDARYNARDWDRRGNDDTFRAKNRDLGRDYEDDNRDATEDKWQTTYTGHASQPYGAGGGTPMTWDNQVRTPHNPHGDFEPQKRHPWQTTYTGNADRPYGGDTRTAAERDLDDRTRYAEGSRRDDERRDQDRDRDYERNRRDNGRNANEFGTGNMTRNRW